MNADRYIQHQLKKNFFWGGAHARAPLCLYKYKNHFDVRFRDGQYSLVTFLFAVLQFYSQCPRAQPFVKVGVGGSFMPD